MFKYFSITGSLPESSLFLDDTAQISRNMAVQQDGKLLVGGYNQNVKQVFDL